MNAVVTVDNLSKLYHIGIKQRAGRTLREAIMDVAAGPWRRLRRLSHWRNGHADTTDGATAEDTIWALRDVSFEVQPGAVVGIIGRNGSGKSTLLKILSRVTQPTVGRIEIRGRTSSLLEVGTGFHPELTGRENIFLNGAILGMSRREIKQKFDEIVDFAEIGRFLDTPVKRYSSGMYVRLAFAVAAHLEPEILILDEVLAVGDAAFQKKCLGKMGKVAREGLTVLFVSHTMSSISALCERVLVLDNGGVIFDGPVRDGIEKYSVTASAAVRADLTDRSDRGGTGQYARLKSIALFNAASQPCDTFSMGDTVHVEMELVCRRPIDTAEIGIGVMNSLGAYIHYFVSNWEGLKTQLDVGNHKFHVAIPRLAVYPGTYTLTAWVSRQGAPRVDDQIDNAIAFVVLESDVTGHNPYFERYTLSKCEVYWPSIWSHSSASEENRANRPALP